MALLFGKFSKTAPAIKRAPVTAPATQPGSRPARDHELVQIVDAAFADAARRSGEWLVCHPGCSQCCVGVFAINALDEVRLREGLAKLAQTDPARAAQVQQRAHASLSRIAADFPGNATTGILSESKHAQRKFEGFGNDEPCPALDPETGTCDLYAHRPMTCRVFGPPVRSEDGLGVCELCYHGASNAEIAACEMTPDPTDLESKLLAEIPSTKASSGRTIVAFCLGRDL
jgi:Fe-S-cluster containining protein